MVGFYKAILLASLPPFELQQLILTRISNDYSQRPFTFVQNFVENVLFLFEFKQTLNFIVGDEKYLSQTFCRAEDICWDGEQEARRGGSEVYVPTIWSH